MKTWKHLSVIALLLAALDVAAQDSNAAADVWGVVEAQWNAEMSGKKDWPSEMLTEDFVGWPKNSPAPRNRSSVEYWNRFQRTIGETVAHELYPLSIVVNGDVAVAHYYYSSAFKPKNGDVEMNRGRFTDVLIRTDDGWKFLTWHGGDD